MLKQRIITAAILIPIVVALLLLLPSWAFCILTGLVTLAGAWEWSNLMGVKTLPGRISYLFLMTLLFIFTVLIPVAAIPTLLSVTFVWWVCAAILVLLYPRASTWWGTSKFWRGMMGVLVLTPCWIVINLIHSQQDGAFALLFLFVIIWGADSAAYFVGKKWGKNKLAPLVSPGKSWEGAFGALVFAALITAAVLGLTHVPAHIWPWIILLSLIVVIFSIIGDLFESMLKRQAGVKDSGNLLPGHGGLLDRIDSLTAAAPIFAFGAWLLGMYLY